VSGFGSRTELPYRNYRLAPPALVARDVMLRAIGILVLLGIGVIHFAQIARIGSGGRRPDGGGEREGAEQELTG